MIKFDDEYSIRHVVNPSAPQIGSGLLRAQTSLTTLEIYCIAYYTTYTTTSHHIIQVATIHMLSLVLSATT